jgi:zinc/manganese transport system substrate-binding protein
LRSILSNVTDVSIRRRWQRTVSGAAALALVLASAACGGSDQDADQSATPTIVASTSIWADITRNVACDGLANVETIVPLGGDPHSFEASLRDRETMENAELIVANGLLLEESLNDTIEAVESAGTPVVRVAEGLDTLGPSTAEDQSGNDPHVWFDPIRVAGTLPAIATALEDVGFDRTALSRCVDTYTAELTAVDEEVAGIVTELAEDQRVLVTNHDSLGYFADRYDFEILGSVIPSASTLAQTNPAELEELAESIEEAGVTAIFVETQHSSSDAQALADRVGDIEVVALPTGTLDEPGTEGSTYLGWLLQNARLIVEGLN